MSYTKEIESLIKFLKNNKTLEFNDSEELNKLLIKIDKKLRTKYGLVWEEDLEEKVVSNLDENFVVLNKEDIFSTENIVNGKFTTPVVLLEGDNMHSLQALKTAKKNFDFIYVDPPYNTLNEKGFKYNDKMVDITDEYRHSKWISFMNKRLQTAYQLMSSDGVMFISIDDNELAQLKLLCNNIFGEKNVELMIWRKVSDDSGKLKITRRFRVEHEYIVVCYKDKKNINFRKYSQKRNYKNKYTNPDNDPRGEYKQGIISETESKSNKESKKYYSVKSPISGKITTRQWRVSEAEMLELIADNRIYFGRDGNSVPSLKVFVNEEGLATPTSILEGLGTAKTAGSDIENILGNRQIFSYPKPVDLIKHLLRIQSKDDIKVLDFFAGSGTTAQAVLELNNEDGGTRTVTLCTNNEVQESTTIEFLIDNHYVKPLPLDVKSNSKVYKSWYKEVKDFINSEDFIKISQMDTYKSLGICRLVTQQRCKKVIDGFDEYTGKYSNGFPGSLTYFTCYTVPKKANSLEEYDVNATKQFNAALEYVMIAEETYKMQKLGDSIFKLYSDKKTVIVNMNNIDTEDSYNIIKSNMNTDITLYVTSGLYESLEYSIFKDNLTVIPDAFFRYYE